MLQFSRLQVILIKTGTKYSKIQILFLIFSNGIHNRIVYLLEMLTFPCSFIQFSQSLAIRAYPQIIVRIFIYTHNNIRHRILRIVRMIMT